MKKNAAFIKLEPTRKFPLSDSATFIRRITSVHDNSLMLLKETGKNLGYCRGNKFVARRFFVQWDLKNKDAYLKYKRLNFRIVSKNVTTRCKLYLLDDRINSFKNEYVWIVWVIINFIA
ncbi:hypothetical protein CWM47_19415 [Spirosoma pollinicola]|uniref:Uncharacterized protein n=1 Tax=Spirosoma pollinicola TaxID=2057025 RepID=A0A2K8Z1P7_9BACT|nr:hypothetical protein CWM47_19415 [Spirosoma pollinicola]